MSLSPDGSSIAFLASGKGTVSILYTLSLEKGAEPHAALSADGRPDRLRSCTWVSNSRLVCTVFGVAYITFPPGQEDAKNRPAIVLPHGGPSDRDQ